MNSKLSMINLTNDRSFVGIHDTSLDSESRAAILVSLARFRHKAARLVSQGYRNVQDDRVTCNS